jgi:hypothetical protein
VGFGSLQMVGLGFSFVGCFRVDFLRVEMEVVLPACVPYA